MFNSYFFSLLLTSCAVESTGVETFVEPDEDLLEEDLLEQDLPEDEIEDVDPCLPDEDAVGVRFEGKIVYPDGTLADSSNTRIHMCSEGCKIAQWGENGFCYSEGVLGPDIYSFKVVPFGLESHATTLSFVTIGEEDVILDDPIVVPEFTHFQDIEDGVFDAGNGLNIEVISEGYEFNVDSGVQLTSVSVDPFNSGLPLNGLDTGSIVGMWYLGTFDVFISPVWSFEVHDTGLPVGSTVKILSGSYSERKWVDEGTATVDEDGVLRTDLDSRISILSTLVLIEE